MVQFDVSRYYRNVTVIQRTGYFKQRQFSKINYHHYVRPWRQGF